MPDRVYRNVHVCTTHNTPPLSVVGPCPVCVAVRDERTRIVARLGAILTKVDTQPLSLTLGQLANLLIELRQDPTP